MYLFANSLRSRGGSSHPDFFNQPVKNQVVANYSICIFVFVGVTCVGGRLKTPSDEEKNGNSASHI